jgi:anti-sigma B factor antagonist
MDLICVHGFVDQQAVLHVSGEIDLATVPLFRDHLTRLVDAHPRTVVVVDLDGVTALDDTGLGMLLGAAGRARQLGGDLVVVSSGERLNARFALTRLDQAVSVRPRI